jgi:hypothetical protein
VALTPSVAQVVVCIVADGRKKIHPRVLDCLTLLGVYQPGDHMKNLVNNKEVSAHLFEYTTSFALDPNLHFKYPDKGIVPTQIIFCMKEKNQKKINSHRWFFNAFSPMLQVRSLSFGAQLIMESLILGSQIYASSWMWELGQATIVSIGSGKLLMSIQMSEAPAAKLLHTRARIGRCCSTHSVSLQLDMSGPLADVRNRYVSRCPKL